MDAWKDGRMDARMDGSLTTYTCGSAGDRKTCSEPFVELQPLLPQVDSDFPDLCRPIRVPGPPGLIAAKSLITELAR